MAQISEDLEDYKCMSYLLILWNLNGLRINLIARLGLLPRLNKPPISMEP